MSRPRGSLTWGMWVDVARGLLALVHAAGAVVALIEEARMSKAMEEARRRAAERAALLPRREVFRAIGHLGVSVGDEGSIKVEWAHPGKDTARYVYEEIAVVPVSEAGGECWHDSLVRAAVALRDSAHDPQMVLF